MVILFCKGSWLEIQTKSVVVIHTVTLLWKVWKAHDVSRQVWLKSRSSIWSWSTVLVDVSRFCNTVAVQWPVRRVFMTWWCCLLGDGLCHRPLSLSSISSMSLDVVTLLSSDDPFDVCSRLDDIVLWVVGFMTAPWAPFRALNLRINPQNTFRRISVIVLL